MRVFCSSRVGGDSGRTWKPEFRMSASKKKVRRYCERFLSFGFIEAAQDTRSPFICHQTLSEESMKPGRLEFHLEHKYPEDTSKCLTYFQNLKGAFRKRNTVSTLFEKQTEKADRALERASNDGILFLCSWMSRRFAIMSRYFSPSLCS